jgi:hypothetical protein
MTSVLLMCVELFLVASEREANHNCFVRLSSTGVTQKV